jgi:hypothetical protein
VYKTWDEEAESRWEGKEKRYQRKMEYKEDLSGIR